MNIKPITAKHQIIKSGFKIKFIAIILIINCTNLIAGNHIWKGGHGGGNWSSGGNWSGGSNPGAGDIVIFDGTGGSNDCVFDEDISVAGIQINAGFTGTISQNGYTFTFGSSGYTQNTATFIGSTTAIFGNGPFILNGGTFTSTSGTFTQIGNFTINSGAVFANNNGTIAFSTITDTITTNIAVNFYNINFVGSGITFDLVTPSAFNVNNTLTFSGIGSGALLSGTIKALGNITVTNIYLLNNNHTATINITGSANQLFTGSGIIGAGRVPNIVINKTGGTLSLASIITCEDNWTYNAGTVDAATNTSTVGFYNTGGTLSGSFYNVTLGDNNRRTLSGAVSISNVLALGLGNIDMNQYTLSILNSTPSAITYITGYIKAEQTNNASVLAWTINATAGNFVFPLGTNAGVAIPFTFSLNSGNVGIFSVTTYPTNPSGFPYPSSPDTVYEMNDLAGNNNLVNTVKRFWQLTKTGATVNATVTFTAASADVGSISNLRAQRYNKINNGWEQPLSGQTNPTSYSVTVPGVTNFSPWTLSGNGVTLPIQLLSFAAAYNNSTKAVHNSWTTASEINNNYFTIQRSADGITFDSIGTIRGAGNSNKLVDYTFDDLNPMQGISYYRLSQTDFDGKVTAFNLVGVDITSSLVSSVKIFPNPGNGKEINLIYSDNNIGDDISVTLTDMTGKTVLQNSFVNEAKGNTIYKISPETTLPAGLYFINAVINNTNCSMKMMVN